MARSAPTLLLALSLVLIPGARASATAADPDTAAARPPVTQEQWLDYGRLSRVAPRVRVAWNDLNGTPRFVAGTPAAFAPGMSVPALTEAVVGFLAEHRRMFKLDDPARELTLMSSDTDPWGTLHLRFQQVCAGLPVFHAQLLAHLSPRGELTAVNGRYVPTPGPQPAPALTPEQAARAATASGQAAAAGAPTLVIYAGGGLPRLCYRVVTRDAATGAPAELLVDAADGTVRYRGDLSFDDYAGTGQGPGIDSQVHTFNIYYAYDFYLLGTAAYLYDVSEPMFQAPASAHTGVIETWDANNFTEADGLAAHADLMADPNADGVFDDNARLPAGNDAHWALTQAYNYYRTRFGRNSWDDHGASVTGYVHYGTNYSNAFWDDVSHILAFGDGNGTTFLNFAGALDVVVHEFTHAVTGSIAGFEYHGQSGALSESYSDIMGAMVDSANWQLGEAIYTPGTPGDALRDLSNPHLSAPWQPANMSEYYLFPFEVDNGGVHRNDGIPNKAACLVATTLGRPAAAQVYYRSLFYLTPQSQFVDARDAVLQAVAERYGDPSSEYAAAEQTYDQVGITSSLPKMNELAADPGGVPPFAAYYTKAGGALGVKLVAPHASELAAFEFYYKGDHTLGAGTCELRAYTSDGGMPGTQIGGAAVYTPPSADAGWQIVDVRSLHIPVSGEFFVTLWYNGVQQPSVGDCDTSNGCSFSRDPVSGTWTLRDNASGSPRTWYLRAMSSTVTTGVLVGELSAEVLDGTVRVRWSCSDPAAAEFACVRATSAAGPYSEIGRLTRAGGQTEFALCDPDPPAGGALFYRVRARSGSAWRETGSLRVEPRGARFRLRPAAPNPAHRSADVEYVLDTTDPYRLELLSVDGRRLRVLEQGAGPAGTHRAHFERSADGAPLPAGLYLIRLTCGGRSEVRRLVLL